MILILLLFAILMTSHISGREFSTDDVDNLFKQLERYGGVKLDDFKNANKQNQAAQHVQQYITVTVLSEQEVTESRNWGNQIPEEFTGDASRLNVIFNRQISQGVFPIDPKKPLHGEVIFLHLDGTINTMLNAFETKQKGKTPYVFVYSFYIPCANVKGVEYSCSQELGEHQLLNQDRFKMVIGWTEIFPGTDVVSSKYFMGIAGIQQFQKENNVFEKKPISAMANPTTKLFQTLYFNCLNAMKYDGSCCVINCNGNGMKEQEKKAAILSYYINIMFATCTVQSRWTGSLTQLRMRVLSECIEKYIDENTGSSCPKFSERVSKKILQFCSIYSQAHASHIGTPQDRNNLYGNTWKQGPNAWSALYNDLNANPATRPEMHCFLPGASMKSICTEMGTDYTDLPDFLKSKSQTVGKKKQNKK